jgi:hypothetical protein
VRISKIFPFGTAPLPCGEEPGERFKKNHAPAWFILIFNAPFSITGNEVMRLENGMSATAIEVVLLGKSGKNEVCEWTAGARWKLRANAG